MFGYVVLFSIRLPNDELGLAIVDSKPLTVASGVSEKDDFFPPYYKENHR